MTSRLKWQTLVGLGAGLMLAGYSLVAVVGCSNATSTDSRPPASQLKDGLTVLDATDPAWGMNAAFVKSSRVIYVQTRVGALKPDVYRQSWPDDPAHEMDMRFVDQAGHTFFIMRGGDRYIDPTWAADIGKTRASNILVPQADRDLDWAMAKEAATALKTALPATFGDHVFHLASFAAQPAPRDNPMLQAKETRIGATSLPSGEKAYGAYHYSGSSWLETDKYSGDTGCSLWVCVAKHSATIMWDCTWTGSSCNWVQAVYANNHGRGANDSGMSYDCYSNGGWYSNATIQGSTASGATGNNDGQGGCQTAYNWDSGGYNHLCNDDASYELWQAKAYRGANGAYGTTQTSHGDGISFTDTTSGGTGGSSNFPLYACDCNNTGCSGDWNTPNCP